MFVPWHIFYNKKLIFCAEPGPNLVPGDILKDVIFLDSKVQRFSYEKLEKVTIQAVLAHLTIVENYAFSHEGEGAQNCLCRTVGPFVEACMASLSKV